MTKLHIDLTNGVLEVEGEEELVRTIYNDFKERLAGSEVQPKNPLQSRQQTTANMMEPAQTKKVKSASRKSSTNSKESYSLIKDLDLTKTSSNISLKDFYKEKAPSSFTEKNLVFVAYLQNVIKVSKVTLDHIYTCYDEVGSRKPSAFKQSIADTSSKKGWFNTSSFDDITLSIRGQNFVDHDLPPKVKVSI